MRNLLKRGQIGETFSWIVSGFVILLVFFFLFIVSMALNPTKMIEENKKINEANNKAIFFMKISPFGKYRS